MSDQAATIAFLSTPAAYGAGVRQVERIDTHGAVVFLAGARAYKLKRAVKFSYMDFSTLELRHAACAAELRLNRRTAPTLYEEVLAVTQSPAGLALGGDGDPVDYVVAMRRFDQDMLFDRLAEAGRLTADMMAELADAIARFHGAAEIRHDFGGGDAMRWVVDINAAGFAAAGAMLEAGAVARLNEACRTALAANAALLDARARDGRLRHCHGDLHLRNICLIEGRPTPFDAVEFNDRIAVIDTLYDFAFLIMDLEHRGMRALANVAFNRYLDAAGDYGGLAAWRLMLACRAGVRAQTGCAAARVQPDESRRAREIAAAQSYLDAAQSMLAPPAPRLIAVAGLSGTGKSTLAKALAPQLDDIPGAVVLRTDVIRKRLAGVAPHERLPDTAYTRAASARVYDAMMQTAEAVARSGHTVITDAVFLQPGERAGIEAAARRAGARFTGLWLDLPVAERERRVTARRADASDATAAVVRLQDRLDPGTVAWPRLDAGRPLETLVADARSQLI